MSSNEFTPGGGTGGDDEDPHDLIIGDVELTGIVEMTEQGPGFTESYKAERERESGGSAEVSEPEPAELHIEAYGDEAKWQQLNALRERRDPFPVAVGPMVFELMGITNLEQRVEAEYPEAILFNIELQEYREVVIQRQNLDEVLGGGEGEGDGSASGTADIPNGWVDSNNDGIDDRTDTPIPETETENVPNGARPVFNVGSGDTFGRVLFDCAGPNAKPVIAPSGNGWAVQDVGLSGPSHNANDAFMGPTTTGGGGLIDHVWMGDGTPHSRGTGIWWNSSSNGDLQVSTSYGAHWRDNWIYGSAPKGPSVLYEDNYAYQNEVSCYRLNSGTVRNCVAHNDASHSGRGARGVWVWSPGPVEVVDCNIRADTGYSLVSGAKNDPGGPINVSGGGITGQTTSRGPSISGAEGEANVDDHANAIPGSAADASRGRSPDQQEGP